jgi:oligopeptide transport system substrate-binding protein
VLVDVLHAARILAAVRRTLAMAGARLRRSRPLAAVAATLLALVTSTSGGPIAAAGPPLRYLAGPAGTLDPAFITSAADVQLLLQLYAGLTRLDETGEPYPSLAEGWTVSDDALTYEFQLRDDLRFSDGSQLTAEDVRRSWLRLLDPATGSSAPDALNVIVGAGERLAGEGSEDDVGIEAPDDRTLVVRLHHPAGYFPHIAATPAAFVVPRHADGSSSWQQADAFVGSGPYAVDGLDGGDLVLRANPEYVAGPPPIDEVRWVGDLGSDPITAFANGELDLVGVSPLDATWLAYDAHLGLRLHESEALTVSYFGFDTSRPPFDDTRVRRAFALALDRERLVPLHLGAAAEPAASLVPPAAWPDGFAPVFESDPDEAARLLDEAGFADRADLGTIVVGASGIDVAPAIAAWREALGVELAVETPDPAEALNVLEDRPPHIYSITWIADYVSPNAIYSLLLLPGAGSNWGRWVDGDFVVLLEAAGAVTEEGEAAAAYRRVDEHVAGAAPVIPWSYDRTWWLVADGLRGLGNLTVGLLDLGRVSWDG